MDLYQISTSQFERIWHLYKHEKQFLKKKKGHSGMDFVERREINLVSSNVILHKF